MPRIARNYQREDFSELLSSLNETGNEEEALKRKQLPSNNSASTPTAPLVSPAKRRRDSLMDNQKMKFAYSEGAKKFHDRSCRLVGNIKDEKFRMSDTFPTEISPCPLCYRKSLIRAGVQPHESKLFEAYEKALQMLKASTKAIHKLTIEHEGKFCGVGIGEVSFAVKDDKWCIKIEANGAFCLYHNSYYRIGDDDRLLRKDFHLQKILENTGKGCFLHFVNIACSYSWEAHCDETEAHAEEKSMKPEAQKAETKPARKYTAETKVQERRIEDIDEPNSIEFSDDYLEDIFGLSSDEMFSELFG